LSAKPVLACQPMTRMTSGVDIRLTGWFIFMVLPFGLIAQGDYGRVDSTGFQDWRKTLPATERFDLFGNRSFYPENLAGSEFPLNLARSGTYTVGAVAIIPLARVVRLRAGASASFNRLVFDGADLSEFPNAQGIDGLQDSLELTFLKLRQAFLEVPVSFALILSREKETQKTVSFLEVGYSFGIELGHSYKLIFDDEAFSSAKLKVTNSPEDLTPFRSGFFARITYTNVGLYSFYRTNPYFSDDNQGSPPPDASVTPWEIGVTVMF